MYDEPPIFILFDVLFNKLDLVIDYYEKNYNKKPTRTFELKTRKLYTIVEVDEEEEEDDEYVIIDGFIFL
ncbi:MAG: hypothetical protein CMQ53_04900 [Gammaproteobacteria bacterium]|nr:hypothetical protein [Gammaproteobacteria bacterium]|tara:strand:+ start:5164 stop:5373 length:210 start_codon:yes stop_codon:yes gene_type:complete